MDCRVCAVVSSGPQALLRGWVGWMDYKRKLDGGHGDSRQKKNEKKK